MCWFPLGVINPNHTPSETKPPSETQPAFTAFYLQGLAEGDVDRPWRILHHSTDLPVQMRGPGRSWYMVKVIHIYMSIYIYTYIMNILIDIMYISYLSICLSVHLFICLFMYLFLHVHWMRIYIQIGLFGYRCIDLCRSIDRFFFIYLPMYIYSYTVFVYVVKIIYIYK